MRGVSRFLKLGPVVLLALLAALTSLSTAAGSVSGLQATAASTKPIANFALCKAPTSTPTPRPTKGPSPTASEVPTEVPPTATEASAATEAVAVAPTATEVPPTEVPVTPTNIPKGGKPPTSGITALPDASGMVRGGGLKCVSVSSVVAGGPADVAGIQKGDFILGVDRTPVKDTANFFTQIDKHASGDVVTITVQRGDAAMSLKVTLGLNQFATVPTASK